MRNEENNIFLKIPYENETSEVFGYKLKKTMENCWKSSKIKIVLVSKIKLGALLNKKQEVDSNSKMLWSDVVYKFTCSVCSAEYVGETARHAEVKVCEHLGISHKTGKKIKVSNNSAIKEHELFTRHAAHKSDFKR